jgi:hypothetical protein
MVDSAPVPVPSAPPASQVLADQRAGNRDAALSALKQIREGSESAASAAQVVTPPAEPVEVVDPAAPAAEPVVAPEVADPVAPAPAAAPVEPPGMAAVRKAEQHSRRQLAAERAAMTQEFEQQKAQWQAKLDKAAEIERKIANARQDPLGLLTAAGLTEHDFDPVGRLVYAASPKGKADPAAAAAAAQELARTGANRDTAAAIAAMQAKIDALQNTITTSHAQAQAQQRLDAYMAGVTKAIGDDAPLARAAFSKNPDRTRNLLTQIADELYYSSGPSEDLRDVPTPDEVLAAYEARRTAELEELGIDPRTIGRTAPALAAVPTPAPTRPTATIAPSGGGAPTLPKVPGPPSRDEVLAGLQKLRTVG